MKSSQQIKQNLRYLHETIIKNIVAILSPHIEATIQNTG